MSSPEIATLHRPSPDIRIAQLDILRGVAVLGIYWINVMVAALPYSVYVLPMLLGDSTYANTLVWAFSETFIDGTMRGLFSILFGASAMLFLNESRLAGEGLFVVDRYYRRTLLLIVFGMFHAWILLWPYDVLYAYGLLGLFLFPLRALQAKTLIAIGLSLLIIGDTAMNEVFDSSSNQTSKLSQTSQQYLMPVDFNIIGNNETVDQSILNQLGEEILVYQSSYQTIFRYQIKDVIEQQSTNMYDTHFFDIGGMMLIGMALFKLGVLNGTRTRRFYLGLIFYGYGSGLLLRGTDIYEALTSGFDVSMLLGTGGPTYNIGRLAMTLGHIGLICLLSQLKLNRIKGTLAAVGRMALTNYLMQSALSIFIFFGFGLGFYSKFERYQLIFICLIVWLIQIIFSLVWLKFFYYGPLEWVWRTLIYGRPQKFRKQTLQEPVSAI
ncbi:MAG: DUF418 domain-containing protein [Gammaproteobacteria bacterium]|nr:DUF418 domain-containing protein [Gammaproteobacteria bacterium]